MLGYLGEIGGVGGRGLNYGLQRAFRALRIQPREYQSRHFSSNKPEPKIAIVGSGPAGFYSAESILKTNPNAKVDIFERLPFPFGLVRYGVAPDHPEVKIVDEKFSTIAHDPRVGFFANLTIGKDISISDLQKGYSAIVLAYGAERDRMLHIPGEGLKGVYSARSFVGYYNSHPFYVNEHFDLNHDSAIVLGQGNVALDVARILLRPHEELATTDISTAAIELLKSSKIRNVHIVGRRGPVQAAFTTKELRELLSIPNCQVVIDSQDLQINSASEEELKAERARKRQFELLSKIVKENANPNAEKKIFLQFFKNPTEFIGTERLTGIRFEKTKLEGSSGVQKALGTSEYSTIDCGVAFRSIGYQSIGMEGVPFDAKHGVIPNVGGRVIHDDESIFPGVYVTGWLKRGPSGIIGTNKYDAQETINHLIDDIEKGSLNMEPKAGAELVRSICKERNLRAVSFDDWKLIDKEEQTKGAALGKPRVKLSLAESMALLPSSPS